MTLIYVFLLGMAYTLVYSGLTSQPWLATIKTILAGGTPVNTEGIAATTTGQPLKPGLNPGTQSGAPA